MTPVEFEVVGLPAAQGSKRHVGNGVMVETSKNLKPWRAAVAAAARDIAADVGQYDEPLHMDVCFRFPMPKSRRAGVRAVGIASKTTAPDLDKLIRSTGDALTTSGLIRDDALICSVHASKLEVVGWSGAVIRLVPVLWPTHGELVEVDRSRFFTKAGGWPERVSTCQRCNWERRDHPASETGDRA